MTYSRVYLDSCILIAAFSSDSAGSAAEPLLEMIGAVGSGTTAPFVTSELTLAESLVRAVRQQDEIQQRSFDNVLRSSGWLDVIPVTREILWGAASLRAWYSHLMLPDAVHLATAIASDCPHFLTEDKGIRGEYEVQALRSGHSFIPRRTQTIRPDQDTLAALQIWLRA